MASSINVGNREASMYNFELFDDACKFNDNSDMLGMELKGDQLKNPRSIVRFLRGTTYYYYNIDTAYKYFITLDNKSDPYTRQLMSLIDIDRIKSYHNYYSKYGDLEVTKDLITSTLKRLFKPGQNHKELDEVISLAKGICQPEDVVAYIASTINSGNEITRASAESYLKDKPVGTFIFRNSSMVSTDYAKVFVLSFVNRRKITHAPYVHIYGRGLFELDTKQITSHFKLPEHPDKIPYISSRAYVSIVDLLLTWCKL
jgi:hypothetical protein